MIDPSTTVRAASDQVSADLSNEAVILALQSGTYYSANEVGAFVWKRLQQPRTVRELCRDVSEEFDVDDERCERDVIRFVRRLERAGLVETDAAEPDP